MPMGNPGSQPNDLGPIDDLAGGSYLDHLNPKPAPAPVISYTPYTASGDRGQGDDTLGNLGVYAGPVSDPRVNEVRGASYRPSYTPVTAAASGTADPYAMAGLSVDQRIAEMRRASTPVGHPYDAAHPYDGTQVVLRGGFYDDVPVNEPATEAAAAPLNQLAVANAVAEAEVAPGQKPTVGQRIANKVEETGRGIIQGPLQQRPTSGGGIFGNRSSPFTAIATRTSPQSGMTYTIGTGPQGQRAFQTASGATFYTNQDGTYSMGI